MTSSGQNRFATPIEMVARINVTPIIDVALVLVIILMITAPMLSVTDSSLELPSSRSQVGDTEERIFVTLARDGEFGVNDEVVPRAQLEGVLAAEIAEHENPVVVVRADRSARHAEVRALLAVARQAGAPRIAVATQPGALR